MKIQLDNIGKKYNREWIFKQVSLEIEQQNSYVILGSNGSGKSTLLQVISGFQTPSTGTLAYHIDGKKYMPEQFFRHVAIAAPYLELYEDFTLMESLQLHQRFKPFVNGLSLDAIPEKLQLHKAKNKAIKHYSSGMKQRVRLGLALLSQTPLLLLDEPTSNLDQNGKDWYGEMIKTYGNDRLIIVCSNQQEEEYFFCKEQINIEAYKS